MSRFAGHVHAIERHSSLAERLAKITRTGGTTFEKEEFGGVMFVPLVGEQAGPKPAAARHSRDRSDYPILSG
ncbi:hypothetical protein [Mesorhizobium sp. A556]